MSDLLLSRLPRRFTVGSACYRLGLEARRVRELVRAWLMAGVIVVSGRQKRTGRMVFQR